MILKKDGKKGGFLGLFHPGKILKVFRNDDKTVFGFDQSVLAMVLMWDENLLTASVAPGLETRLKEGDVVLLDYSPEHPTLPMPRQLVVKVLRGDLAKTVWKEYDDQHKKRKPEIEPAFSVEGHPVR